MLIEFIFHKVYNVTIFIQELIYLGVFDFNKKTWTMWTNDPINTPPLLQLPLTFTDLIGPTANDVGVNRIEVIETFYPEK